MPIILACCLCTNLAWSQGHSEYLGAGHSNGITVTTSHTENIANDGNKTIDGFPVEDDVSLYDASRFLAQATLGYDSESIKMVAAMGFEEWLDEQFELPVTSARSIARDADEVLENDLGDIFGYYEFRSLWWNLILRQPDLLRQRITYSLSQIFVVSASAGNLFNVAADLSNSHYDFLNQNAFGNYRDLLSDVSRSPSMGKYLSHMFNPRSVPQNNTFPDENYAREVMQLFSIGLYELNQDGSRKLDSSNNFIPTYNIDDIKEFAKIFTGFGDGHSNGEWQVFGESEAKISSHIPMEMYEEWHEPGIKYLLNDEVVPSGQSGIQDFEDAIDNLFHHPNVGPFFGKAMIQFLVTSNPSPAYISRVAAAFNDNGDGIRGDIKAVIKAILLDEEARQCDPVDHPTAGKLREPIIRYTGAMKAFKGAPTGDFILHSMSRWFERVGQVPLYAPSVFNFYLPDYQPNGIIADLDLVAPAFQIHNSTTSIGYLNEVNSWTRLNEFIDDISNTLEDMGIEENDVLLDLSEEMALAGDPAALTEHLNILLACGQLSVRTKEVITEAITYLSSSPERISLAVYLVLMSPDYAILK